MELAGFEAGFWRELILPDRGAVSFPHGACRIRLRRRFRGVA